MGLAGCPFTRAVCHNSGLGLTAALAGDEALLPVRSDRGRQARKRRRPGPSHAARRHEQQLTPAQLKMPR
jgi:hypothetical protein